MNGTVQFTVESRETGEPLTYTFTIAEDRVVISEQAAEDTDAHVRGDVSAWINAFSPDGDRSALEIRGSAQLAAFLLDGLGAGPGRATDASRAAA
jgi:hypothetical protein